MSEVETLEAVIGARVRELREGAGMTLDQLAQEVRRLGVKWSKSRASEFEKGQLRVTLPILLAVGNVLSRARGDDLMLWELLPSEPTWVKVADNWRTRSNDIQLVLSGRKSFARLAIETEVEGGPTLVTTTGSTVTSYAEQSAARRLGIADVALWSAATDLWGHTFTAEMVRRDPGPEASPQARGQVTRRMTEELREYLRQRQPRSGAVGPGKRAGREEVVDGDD